MSNFEGRSFQTLEKIAMKVPILGKTDRVKACNFSKGWKKITPLKA